KDLHPGTPVLIILKADQRSGKTTSGCIQDILTRGDHPRGIKVRLADGRVGRVQSLGSTGATGSVASSSSLTSREPIRPAARVESEEWDNDNDHGNGNGNATSLMDYIKPTKKSQATSTKESAPNVQERLEKQFPDLDTSLIAAILVDYPSLQDAEGVLRTLGPT
ncbi:MAG: hypothetical protein Q9168_007332, partial [Polycauliona sp. 1 TL-2023]